MTTVANSNSGWQKILGSYGNDTDTGNSQNSSAWVEAAKAAKDLAATYKSNASEEDKIYATKERVSIAVADYYTGGYASKALAWANKQWPGTMEKLRNFDKKTSLVYRGLVKLLDTDKWKTEGKRLGNLLEKGVQIPESLQGPMQLTRGRTKEELIDASVDKNFVGVKPDGTWVNNKFAASRSEKDLRPEDIIGCAAFFEKFGNDWTQKFTHQERLSIASKALESGAVDEHHGTIDIRWSPELEQITKDHTNAVKK